MVQYILFTLHVASYLSSLIGIPCDIDGHELPPGADPPPRTTASADNWSPYDSDVQFKTADFLFRTEEMSQNNINYLLELWGLSLTKHNDMGPFSNYKEIYDTIDSTKLGDAPWKCFSAGVDGDLPDDAPRWKQQKYDVWHRDPDIVIANMLNNPDFNGEFDMTPYVHLDANGKRRWSDYMSANSAWRRCVSLPHLLTVY